MKGMWQSSADTPLSPERKLACAKILQMLTDLKNPWCGDEGEKMMAQINAEKLLNSRELDDWCEMAGIDVGKVRQAAERAKAGQLDLRPKKPGTGERWLEKSRYWKKLHVRTQPKQKELT